MRWRISLCCAMLGALAAAPVFGANALAALANWRADSCVAARDQRPLVLLFTLPGCRFCEDLRQRYMGPLARDGEIVREVVIDSDQPVTGFAGAATQRAVAHKFGAKFAPIVLLVDAHAQPLADPIVGGDVAGMYGAYLDNALAEARRRLVTDAARKARETSPGERECRP